MKLQGFSNLTLIRVGACGFVLFYCIWMSTKVAHASTTFFSDAFDGPLGTNWQLIQDRQMTDAQKTCMNRYEPASWLQDLGKLKLEINGPSCLIDIAPSNVELRGLDQYSLSFRMTLKDSIQMDRSVVFLFMDQNNWYDVKFFGSTIVIEKVVNGVVYPLSNAQQQFPFQANREYFINVVVQRDQHIDVLIDQQQVLSVDDQGPFIAPLTRQFFVLRGVVGAVARSVVWMDDVTLDTDQSVRTLLNLNVPLFKQTDPAWKSLEYDTAHLWSTLPTMNRWGCAVTSMAMILRYYGISQLPSGEILTPQTLNVWLREQADGYFSGNVNWLAFSRLTRIMNKTLGTPKLEFSRTDGTFAQITAFATQELNANKPVIIGYPGHFFVADGFDKVNNTLLTKDPFYSYTKLNQRPTAQEVNTIRRFQPSHTDLSYILLNVSPGLSVTVKNPSGENVPLVPATEYISDPTGETGETSPLSQQFLIQKPSTDVYKVHVNQTQSGPYTLDTYSYDIAGTVEGTHYQGNVGSEGKDITVAYTKEVPPSPVESPLPEISPSPSLSPTPSPSPLPTPSLTPTPSVSPAPAVSPSPLARPLASYNQRMGHSYLLLQRYLLEELHKIELLLRFLPRSRGSFLMPTYRYFSNQLERLKRRTN